MKKIIFLLLAMSIGFLSKAQFNFAGTTTTPGTVTSNTVTGFAGYTYSTVEIPVLNATIDTAGLSLTGQYNLLVKVHARLLKTSGTIAGTVRLYGSMYGTTGTWSVIGDTLTLANQTVNEHVWNLTSNDVGWKFLRILQSGGTTMAGTLSIRTWGLKPNN